MGLAEALTHWGRVTHTCVSKLSSISSDNGLSPGRRQAIIWTNAGILLIGPLGTNFNETSIEIHTFSFKKIRLKLSSGKWRPFCVGLNVLTHYGLVMSHAIIYFSKHCFREWPCISWHQVTEPMLTYVNKMLKHWLPWNLYQNSNFTTEEDAFIFKYQWFRSGFNVLTHWGKNTKFDISQTIFWHIFFKRKWVNFIQISSCSFKCGHGS